MAMADRKQDSEHYQVRPNGTEWITLERKDQGRPGEIRVAEIDEVIELLRRVRGDGAGARRDSPVASESRGGFGARK